MPPARTIRCADCGSETKTVRSNTKYCGFHRLFRDIIFVRNNAQRLLECPLCAKKFLPLKYRQIVCVACQRLELEPATCFMCGKERVPISEFAQICAECAEAPKNTVDLLKALGKKDRWLRDHPAALDDETSRVAYGETE